MVCGLPSCRQQQLPDSRHRRPRPRARYGVGRKASVKAVNRSGGRDDALGLAREPDGKTLSEVRDHNLSLVGSGDIPVGGCVARNTPLQWVIALAYQIPWDRENQVILGGPSWVSAGLDSPERFDIDAKTEQPATRAQLLQMLCKRCWRTGSR